MFSIPSIEPYEAKTKADKGELIILDIREPFETSFTSVEGTHNIPLSQLNHRIEEIMALKDKEVAILCRSGSRSAQLTHYLRMQGFNKVFNITGGILKWADQVDSSVRKYATSGEQIIEMK
ncbi:MAG: rhodanese-like domain-containing protein [Methanobacteriota archaeon]|nr:MAG: rhodanese-like domain-containing protein [Euryarchaeota archaeon]